MAEWVRSGALQGAKELIGELGGDPRALAREAGVDPAAFRDPDFPVRIDAFVGFIELAARRCECPTFGLRLSSRQALTLFGPLWPQLNASGTFAELLQRLARVFPQHTQGALVSLEPDDEGQWIVYDLATGAGASQRQTVELGFGIVVNEVRRVIPAWRPRSVSFRHAAPLDNSLHQRLFGGGIDFDADRNALLVDADALRRPLSGAGEPSPAVAVQAPAGPARLSRGVTNRAEIAVRALLPFGDCELADVAAALGLTARTLQRRLADEGRHFVDIRDRVRADLARYYVRDSRLSAAAVAEILQFSQTSALSRAFRRWHGTRLSAERAAARTT